MKELLNINMESSDIDETWVRSNYILAAERKTSTRTAGRNATLNDAMFGYGLVPYDKFFDIIKSAVDIKLLQIIVDNNITCTEKQIKVQMEMTNEGWYDEFEPAIYLVVEWKHKETIAEVIKRLITTNKRALTAMKRKAKNQDKLAQKIKNMSAADRAALKELL
jgi:hypothetical protein